jgi:hypothetical protein
MPIGQEDLVNWVNFNKSDWLKQFRQLFRPQNFATIFVHNPIITTDD